MATKREGVTRSALKTSKSGSRSQRHVKRSAATGRFVSGSMVKVPFGAREYWATVVEERNGRVHVTIQVLGADEAMRSSYTPDQVLAVAEPTPSEE